MVEMFAHEIKRIRLNRGLSVKEMSDVLGVSEKERSCYESGEDIPTIEFVAEFMRHFNNNKVSGLTNEFVQPKFSTKIPFVSEKHVDGVVDKMDLFYEIPDTDYCAGEGLFAMRYCGDDIPEWGVLSGSTIIFVNCHHIGQDGVYAVMSRGCIKIKKAEVINSNGEVRVTPLDGANRIPKTFKNLAVKGRMVCCINNYR